ncbi:MAG: T9SS type A sorting domain-containing protein, partial [bacterium]
YIEKGSVAVWADLFNNQWEIYASQRNEFGGWTTPKNISQTVADSKYPQVAMYQTNTQTRFVYVWTEGNSSPYEVKILPISSFHSNPIPLYAFDLGEKEPSVFTGQRTGYIVYGSGYEKSVDYDTSGLSYVITGLDPDRIYHLGLVFYQDETNQNWKQNIEIDDVYIKTIKLPRKRIVVEKFTLNPDSYQDGVVRLKIKKLNAPKAVLSGFAVWEFYKEKCKVSTVNEYNSNRKGDFSIFMLPNPAHGKVVIHYQTTVEEEIAIKIFSVAGGLIRLINDHRPAGSWSTIWDGKDSDGKIVANGVYFVRVETHNKTATGKIVILR